MKNILFDFIIIIRIIAANVNKSQMMIDCETTMTSEGGLFCLIYLFSSFIRLHAKVKRIMSKAWSIGSEILFYRIVYDQMHS